MLSGGSGVQAPGARWDECLAPDAAGLSFGVVLEGSSQSWTKELRQQDLPVRQSGGQLDRLLVLYLADPLTAISSPDQLYGLPRLTVLHSVPPSPEPSRTAEASVSVDGVRMAIRLLHEAGAGPADAEWSAWLHLSLSRHSGREDCGVQIVGHGGIDLPVNWHRSPSATAYYNRRSFFGLP